MDKNTGLYIVFGFLLLCILLSLDKKEGFVTINSSSFCIGNSDANTCDISLSGSTGYICQNNENNVYYTESTTDGLPRNLASGSFNITATGCSDIGYLNGEDVSASPCSHSGEEYTLSGCSPKCVRPSIPEYYNLNGYSLPTHISPEEGNDGIRDTTMTCNDNMGYYDAINVCFYRDTGEISFSQSRENCLTGSRPGIWYDSTGGNGVKLVCNAGSSEYKIIGCEQGCLSRIRDMGEYYTLDDTDRDKEIVQILDRSDDGTTTLKLPSSTLYNVTENNITPSSEFSVDVTGGETIFKSVPTNNEEIGIPVNFDGQTTVGQCSGGNNRKYIVNGLFPTCNAEHECLNFSVTYRRQDTPENIYNINDFKQHLRDNIGGIIGSEPTQDQIDEYINSLYYYRRYKDSDDNIHIEGQLRCDTDENSEFYCEIGGEEETGPITWILGDLGQNCDTVCGDSTCMIPDRDDIDSNETMRQKILDARGDSEQIDCVMYRPLNIAQYSIGPDYQDCHYPNSSVNLQTYQCEEIYTYTRPLCKCQG